VACAHKTQQKLRNAIVHLIVCVKSDKNQQSCISNLLNVTATRICCKHRLDSYTLTTYIKLSLRNLLHENLVRLLHQLIFTLLNHYWLLLLPPITLLVLLSILTSYTFKKLEIVGEGRVTGKMCP